MGIPNSAFSRLCAALRTPMASFSSSSCGWLRGWLQQVLVKQSARSSISSFLTHIRTWEKKSKKHNTKIPQRQRPVIQHIPASFLFCREGLQKEDIYTSYFPLHILHWDLPLPSTALQASVWYTWGKGFLSPTYLLREPACKDLVYLSNAS